ncbi:prepilin-type N-terminal cleavage/methylation domain-containing protein [Thermodesulfobacteriota bacterium]
MVPNITGEQGFSVLEVLVAFGILSIGMLAVGTLLVNSMDTDRYSAQHARADFIASRFMEDLKSQAPHTDITTGKRDKGAYHTKWVTIPDNPVTGMRTLVVVVGWGGGNGCSKETPGKCKHRTSITNYVIQRSP